MECDLEQPGVETVIGSAEWEGQLSEVAASNFDGTGSLALQGTLATAGAKALLACHVISHSKTTGLKVESTRGVIDAIPVSATGSCRDALVWC